VIEWLTALLLLIGAAFMLLAGIGIVRQPDLFTRMQAATKAATLGAICTLLAVAVYFSDLAITTRALLISLFIFLTAPVSAHLIARAAYFVGAPLWRGTVIDELQGQYDRRTHILGSEAGSSVAPTGATPLD
jgi:multicomponent Na+:H+ antiporter subunit G